MRVSDANLAGRVRSHHMCRNDGQTTSVKLLPLPWLLAVWLPPPRGLPPSQASTTKLNKEN